MKKLIFAIVTFFLALVIIYFTGELIIYQLYKKDLALFPRYVTGVDYNGYMIRGNVPNAQYRHKSYDGQWKFRINSKGFRSDFEYSYEKTQDVLRILVLGDSYTMGHEVNQDETYSVVLENRLKKIGINAEVMNAGVSGFSNAEELVFFEQEGIKYNPDIVVVGFYNNDLRDNVRANLYIIEDDKLKLNSTEYQPAIAVRDFLNSFYIYRWLSEYSYLHNYLNEAATRYFKKIFLKGSISQLNRGDQKIVSEEAGAELIIPSNPNAVTGDRYEIKLACKLIERMNEIAESHNIRFILLDVALDIDPARPQLFSSVPDACVSEQNYNYYVDSAELLLRYHGSRDDLYRPNGRRHWSDKAHQIVGDYLADLIVRDIGEKKPD